MSRWLLALVSLVLVYLLVLASVHPWDIVFGVLLAALLLALTRGYIVSARIAPIPHLFRRTLAFFPFAIAVLVNIIKGTWDVALVVMHLRPLRSPGVVAIPIGERTPLGVFVTCLEASLSPGAFLLDIDDEQGVLLLHVLDASDPDAVRAANERFYQRFQRPVFP